jgi:hypothetical protein
MLRVVKPNVTELEPSAPDPAAPLANASQPDVALNQAEPGSQTRRLGETCMPLGVGLLPSLETPC